jgi:hypothetical protein
MRFAPYSFKVMRLPTGVYFCKVYRPHILAEAINSSFPNLATYYAVNIGAGDGKSCFDPVYPLFVSGYAGLALEWEDNKELFKNIPSPTVKKLTGVCVTPQNVAEILNSVGCPKQCDFLKIDVDGYDGPILKAILESGYQPKVLQVEINPEIPPPIEFAVLYHPGYRCLDMKGRYGGFYGASLSYVLSITKGYGYKLAYIDFLSPYTHDVTLVKEEFIDVAADIFGRDIKAMSAREFYFSHPPYLFSQFGVYGIDSSGWRYRTDYELLIDDIRNACLSANTRKHGDSSVPFYLAMGPDDVDSSGPGVAVSRAFEEGKATIRDCCNVGSVRIKGTVIKGWGIRGIISKRYILLAELCLLSAITVRHPLLASRFFRTEVRDATVLLRQAVTSFFRLRKR